MVVRGPCPARLGICRRVTTVFSITLTSKAMNTRVVLPFISRRLSKRPSSYLLTVMWNLVVSVGKQVLMNGGNRLCVPLIMFTNPLSDVLGPLVLRSRKSKVLVKTNVSISIISAFSKVIVN